ncbi:MAG: hypothetical protein Q8S20_14290 [Sulfuritalea sp.]|nr:hypothetical protein [Sulfuritalea sp.]
MSVENSITATGDYWIATDKQLTASSHTSVNRLFDELATIALVQHDLMQQFRAAADSGDPARGLALLERLDKQCGSS